MPKTFYITTTLPYVNADPHVGFAMEIIRADIIARSKKLQGFEVFFNTGTDEHGQKLFDAAKKAGKDVQEYVDGYAEHFKNLIPMLGLSEDIHFVRTTDEQHVRAAQEFWKRCCDNGDIYKKNYSIKYCVGCELEKQDSDLVDGKCPLHPTLVIEIIDEENYFFKWSKYGQYLLDFYEKNPNFVIPAFRFNEIKAFVERGLEDFSISRLKSKMSWGVPVPGDDAHVMYVWFDALVSYISTLGWPDNTESFEKFWRDGTPVQYAGKDNLRQQSAMWQAMLASAKLPQSHTIVIDGFINSGGQKMSKSIGNVLAPGDFVSEYGTDALRYYVARELSTFEDSDMTAEKFKDAYNANLANGLGNLVSRILALSEKYIQPRVAELITENEERKQINPFVQGAFDSFDIQAACDAVWILIGKLDKRIAEDEVFKLVKTDPVKGGVIIQDYLGKLVGIACDLKPILPKTAEIIIQHTRMNKKPSEPLFLRKD
jgi:methionyl-tRNA synthetase